MQIVLVYNKIIVSV